MEQPWGSGLRDQSGSRRGRLTRARTVVFGVLIGIVIGLPTVSLASILTQNFLQGTVEVDGPLVEAYDYQQGTNQTWEGTADFDLGTYTDTAGDLEEPVGTALDQLTLDVIGPDGTVAADTTDIAWWDEAWATRHCVELDHTDPAAESVTEYQYRVELGDLDQLVADGFVQANFQDFRAVAADGATQLPLWVDEFDDAVWVQVDEINANETTHFCVYFGHEDADQTALAFHTELDVFTHSTPKDLYYAVHDNYGAGAGVQIDIASLVDSNVITVDGAAASTQTLDSGQLSTFAGLTPESVISSTGPLSARSAGIPGGANGTIRSGAGFDSLVPISWASTDFVIPAERGRQRIHIYAPFATSSVDIYEGGNAVPLGTIVVPVGQSVWIEPPGDPIDNEGIIVEADVPVLLVHDYTSGNDVYPVVPFLDDEWYGVSSTTRVSADTTVTHIDQYQSNGAVLDRALNRGQWLTAGSGGSQGGGTQSGTRLVLDVETTEDPEASDSSARFAAITQADSDGVEIATFFPRSELSNRYLIPTNLQYVTFACPEPNFDIEVTAPGSAPVTLTCTGLNGASVGWAKLTADLDVVRSGGAPGTAIEVASTNGEPFYVYYEHQASNDETNVLGMKQARQKTWPEPVETIRLEGLFHESGTWLSPTVLTGGTTGVYGEINFEGEFDPGTTTIKVQVATGPALPPTTFVGPDGTTGTFFAIDDLPQVLDFGHDGDDYVRLLVTLETTDRTVTPRVDNVGVDFDLPLVARDVGVPSPIAVDTVGSPAAERAYLIRLKTTRPDVAGSTVRLLDAGATPSVTTRDLMLENVALAVDSTQTSGGANGLDTPQSFGPGQDLSVLGTFGLAAVPDTGSLLVLVHVDVQGRGIIAETDLDVELETSP